MIRRCSLAGWPVFGFSGGSKGDNFSHCSSVSSPLLILPILHRVCKHALAHEVGSWNWIRIVSGFLARVLLLQQDFKQAESILTAALEPDAPMQPIGQRLVWAARAELALTRGDHDLALDITDWLIASAANLS